MTDKADSAHHGWIGVDFDGTLATYDGWKGAAHCGEPIGAMVFRVKKWLAEGWEVRIFTARAYCPDLPAPHAPEFADAWNRRGESVEAVRAIKMWCQEHIGQVLQVTCVKDYGMVELWDDRAVQVEANTGNPIGRSTRGLS